jgi:hypothetical protein
VCLGLVEVPGLECNRYSNRPSSDPLKGAENVDNQQSEQGATQVQANHRPLPYKKREVLKIVSRLNHEMLGI